MQIRGFSIIEYLIEELPKPTNLDSLVALEGIYIPLGNRLGVHIFSIANNFVVILYKVSKVVNCVIESNEFFRSESGLVCQFTKQRLHLGAITLFEVFLCVPFQQALIIAYTGLLLQEGDEVYLLIGQRLLVLSNRLKSGSNFIVIISGVLFVNISKNRVVFCVPLGKPGKDSPRSALVEITPILYHRQPFDRTLEKFRSILRGIYKCPGFPILYLLDFIEEAVGCPIVAIRVS